MAVDHPAAGAEPQAQGQGRGVVIAGSCFRGEELYNLQVGANRLGRSGGYPSGSAVPAARFGRALAAGERRPQGMGRSVVGQRGGEEERVVTVAVKCGAVPPTPVPGEGQSEE